MKRNFKFLFMVVMMATFICSSLGVTAFAEAKVGDVLAQPEDGWKRYEHNDSLISYFGAGWRVNAGCDMGTVSKTGDEKVRFSFSGTSLRILGYSYDNRSDQKITIDGEIMDTYSNSIKQNHNTLIYEKIGLEDKVHSVEIIREGNGEWFAIDAIDVIGEMVPYEEQQEDSKAVLNIEPEKEKIKRNEVVTANLSIDNIKDIAAEDIRIKYDTEKLEFVGQEEVEGIKLVKADSKDGELRFIVASKGESNIVNAKKILLKLNFRGIKAGEAIVDVIKGRVSDGVEMEKDLTEEQCGEGKIIIEDMKDVNNSGEFTLLDLGIDARHLGKDPKATELANYNTDIVLNDAIDEADLLEIGKFMIDNPNYEPNKY